MHAASRSLVRPLSISVLVATSALAGGCASDLEPDEDVALSVDALRAPAADGFTFAQSRDELEKSVPVTSGGDAWTAIYSVRIDGLTAKERVAVRGEVQLTRCHQSDVDKGTPCKSALADGADLDYRAQIVVGGGPRDADGERVGSPVKIDCSHFDHHCNVAVDEAALTGLVGTKFVKLVVAAKGNGKVMIVDEGHGGLAVTRMGAEADRAGRSFETGRATGSAFDSDPSDIREAKGLPGRKPHVTFQLRIDDARPGDILDVDARIVAITSSGGARPARCSGAREPLVTHQVFLSKGRDAEGTKVGTLTAKNGTNCRLDARCGQHKSGAVSVPEEHAPGKPLYVSVVSSGGRSCAASGDTWRIDSDSRMHVRRRRGAD